MSEITNSNGHSDSTVTSPNTIHDFHDANSDDGVGYAVVAAAAAARGTDPLELPPIYDCIDVDALDALVTGSRDRPDDVDGRVTFEYAGFEVTVAFDGWIHLDPVGAPSVR